VTGREAFERKYRGDRGAPSFMSADHVTSRRRESRTQAAQPKRAPDEGAPTDPVSFFSRSGTAGLMRREHASAQFVSPQATDLVRQGLAVAETAYGFAQGPSWTTAFSDGRDVISEGAPSIRENQAADGIAHRRCSRRANILPARPLRGGGKLLAPPTT